MYYHLAGRTATAVDVLETTVSTLRAFISAMDANCKSLAELTEKLKTAQQLTEEMFLSADDDDEEPT